MWLGEQFRDGSIVLAYNLVQCESDHDMVDLQARLDTVLDHTNDDRKELCVECANVWREDALSLEFADESDQLRQVLLSFYAGEYHLACMPCREGITAQSIDGTGEVELVTSGFLPDDRDGSADESDDGSDDEDQAMLVAEILYRVGCGDIEEYDLVLDKVLGEVGEDVFLQDKLVGKCD